MAVDSFYLAYLSQIVPGFGFQHFSKLKSLNSKTDEIQRLFRLPSHWQNQADQWLKSQSIHTDVHWPESQSYPTQLLSLKKPPLFLFSMGTFSAQSLTKIAVFGSRDLFKESQIWMEKYFGEFLNESPVTIVSGGARGVDQTSHFLAIRYAKPTWVLLPSGLGTPYPASWKKWSSDVIEGGGALISEYSYQTPMRKYHFLRRNELIAGLSDGGILVQGARRSGSLLTAKWLIDQNKALGVLPHFPHLRTMGGLDLLADGAILIKDHLDLKVFLGLLSTRFIHSSGAEEEKRDIDGPNC